MTSIPGPRASSTAPNRLGWDNPLLEPKQQHRFFCEFPIYMPKGSVTDSAILAVGGTGTRVASILKKFEDYTNVKALPPDTKASAANAPDLDNLKAVFVNGETNEKQALKHLFGGQDNIDAFGTWYRSYSSVSWEKRLYRRLSAYVVTSFTPPSFGITIGKAPLVANPQDEAASVIDNKATMDAAQITLVSTLQDDLHFSLSFLYQFFNPSKGDDDSGGNILMPHLYPEALWPDLPNPVLSIIDVGARPNPENPDPLAYEPPAGREHAKEFPSTPIGIHKLHNPFVSGISFSEYNYAGADFLLTTVTLSPSDTNQSFYSYETYINTKKKGGDTRYGRYSGLGPRGAARGPTHPVNRLQQLITEAYARWPNWYVKTTDPLQPATGTENSKIIENIQSQTKETLDNRMENINGIMAKAARTAPAGRRGMLYPLLEGLSEAEARATADRQATDAARSAAADRSMAIAGEDLARESRDLTDHSAGDVRESDRRAQEQRMVQALRQGGASRAEIQTARQNIRDEQASRPTEGSDVSSFGQ